MCEIICKMLHLNNSTFIIGDSYYFYIKNVKSECVDKFVENLYSVNTKHLFIIAFFINKKNKKEIAIVSI